MRDTQSPARYKKPSDTPFPRGAKDAAGRVLCAFCGQPIPPGSRRSVWCSQKCFDEWGIRSGSGSVRWHAAQRDHGICEACGCDTEKLRRVLRWALLTMTGGEVWLTGGHKVVLSHLFVLRKDAIAALVDVMGSLGFGNRRLGASVSATRMIPTLWQADHITPVAYGGGGCGLDNIRTLCLACHQEETNRLNGELAKARRQQARLPTRVRGGE